MFRLSRRGGTVLSGPRPGQSTAAFLPFRHWASSLSHLLGPPSTCSQRLPRCPAQACRQQDLGTTTQPTFRECLTDSSPIFLVPLPPITHRTLPCRHSSSSSLGGFAAHHRTASSSLPTFTVICSRPPKTAIPSPHPATSPASSESSLQTIQPAHPAQIPAGIQTTSIVTITCLPACPL